MILGLVLLGSLLVAFATIHRVIKQRPDESRAPGEPPPRELLSTFKILLNFLQTYSFLADFDLEWPNALRETLNLAGSVTTFSFNSSFADCLLGWSPRGQFVGILVLIPIVLLVPGLFIGYLVQEHQRTEGRRIKQNPDLVPIPLTIMGVTPLSLYTTTVMVSLFLLYPTITRQALNMLTCSDPIDGVAYLVSDFSVRCDDESNRAFVALAYVVLAVVTVGFPLFSAGILYSFRTQLDTERARRRFWFLYSGYKRERFYYESFVMARKACIVATSSVLGGNRFGHQLLTGVFVQLGAFLAHELLVPYADPLQNFIEQTCLVGSIVALLLGQLLTLGGISPGMRTFVGILVAVIYFATIVLCLGVVAYDTYHERVLERISNLLRNAVFTKRNRPAAVLPPRPQRFSLRGRRPASSAALRTSITSDGGNSVGRASARAEPLPHTQLSDAELAEILRGAPNTLGDVNSGGIVWKQNSARASLRGRPRPRGLSRGREILLELSSSPGRERVRGQLLRLGASKSGTEASGRPGGGPGGLATIDERASMASSTESSSSSSSSAFSPLATHPLAAALGASSSAGSAATHTHASALISALQASSANPASSTPAAAFPLSSASASAFSGREPRLSVLSESRSMGFLRRGRGPETADSVGPSQPASLRSLQNLSDRSLSRGLESRSTSKRSLGLDDHEADFDGASVDEFTGIADFEAERALEERGLSASDLPAMSGAGSAAGEEADEGDARETSSEGGSPQTEDSSEVVFVSPELEEVQRTWKECNHPTTGQAYWYNPTTKRTSWEKPEELERAEALRLEEMRGWRRVRHPTNGLPYWVNPERMVQQWHRPAGLPILPEEAWWEATHPQRPELKYYVNLVSREQQWEPPADFIRTPLELLPPVLQSRALVLLNFHRGGQSP